MQTFNATMSVLCSSSAALTVVGVIITHQVTALWFVPLFLILGWAFARRLK